MFARAQVLVSAGEGKEGRAVVDSLLARIPASSLRYAEGLFWRATLAGNALDAERDYRRIAVEYVLSPRVPSALTRLAQLELARGDRDAGEAASRAAAPGVSDRARNERVPGTGSAASPSSRGDAGRACAAIDSARALTTGAEVELTNQIASDARRCLTRADGSLAAAGGTTDRAVRSGAGCQRRRARPRPQRPAGPRARDR